MEYINVSPKDRQAFLNAFERCKPENATGHELALTHRLGETTNASCPSIYKIRKDIFECMKSQVDMEIVKDAL